MRNVSYPLDDAVLLRQLVKGCKETWALAFSFLVFFFWSKRLLKGTEPIDVVALRSSSFFLDVSSLNLKLSQRRVNNSPVYCTLS